MSFHWIEVDVVDGSLHSFGSEEISIESGTFLPESKATLARTLTNGEGRKQVGAMLNEDLFNRLRERLFDPIQKAADVGFGSAWQDEKMNVFRHIYESIEHESFVAGCVDAAGQLFPPSIIRE